LWFFYLLLAGMLLLPVNAMASTFYVAQQAPNCADTNPGSEAQPCKTLTHACTAANPGDVIWVKAGVYSETLAPRCNNLTVQAYGNDHVVITPPRTLVADSAWTRVPGTKNVYQYAVKSANAPTVPTTFERAPDDLMPASLVSSELGSAADPDGLMVRMDGMALQYVQTVGHEVHFSKDDGTTTLRPLKTPPLDTLSRCWTRTADGALQVNLDGENPAKHRMELMPNGFVGIDLSTNECIVRGFEVREAQTGIRSYGMENVAQFCLVRNAFYGALFLNKGSFRNTLHACAFLNVAIGIDCEDFTGNQIFDSNLIIGAGYQPLTTCTSQRDFTDPQGWGNSLRYGKSNNNVFRYNIAADGSSSGWWPDVNCYANYLYGNIFTRFNTRAIYNEYPVNDTKLLYNAITHSGIGICSRFSWRMFVMHNYVADNETAVSLWGPHEDNPYIFDNTFSRNLFTDSGTYIEFGDDTGEQVAAPADWNSDGHASISSRFRSFSNLIANNSYKGPAKKDFAMMDNESGIYFPTLKAFQQATGLETGTTLHPDARMEDQGLGLYTVRIPDSMHPDEPVSMVGNPMRNIVHVDPLPVAAEDAPYFWTQGDASAIRGGQGWVTNMGATYEWDNSDNPVRRLIRSKPGNDAFSPFVDGDAPRVWLECVGWRVDKINPAGDGFWSPVLTTVPGAKITLSWQMQGEGLEPVGEHGGPLAFIRFQSYTGQDTDDVVLLGRQADAVIADGKTAGTFDWTKYTASVIAPATAKRFSVFLGLRPAKGIVRYGDIYINTAPGQAPVEPTVGAQTFISLDLTPYLNHPLDKDAGTAPGTPANWQDGDDSDSQHTIDLSGVKPGQLVGAGVPFTVRDRVVTLNNYVRPSAGYSLSALAIPVRGKVHTLNFLHAGQWIERALTENWRYVVHYADGQSVEIIPVEDPTALAFKHPYFNEQATLEPTMVIGKIDGIGDVLRWVNPRPDVAVQSVDFRGMNMGQAVLLAVTAGDVSNTPK
jgi:hypothetical protein